MAASIRSTLVETCLRPRTVNGWRRIAAGIAAAVLRPLLHIPVELYSCELKLRLTSEKIAGSEVRLLLSCVISTRCICCGF